MSATDTMLDKVAMAIMGVDGFLSERQCYDYARAAIEAMREPTDAMCDAADWQQQSEVNQDQRAIDAALSA